MTTSTFSCVAMSPPRLRFDVSHIRDVEPGVAVHRRVNDIDGIAAQHEVDERSGRTLPALDLVLAHLIYEGVPLAVAELGDAAIAVVGAARFVHRTERGAVEIRIRRTDVENARFE